MKELGQTRAEAHVVVNLADVTTAAVVAPLLLASVASLVVAGGGNGCVSGSRKRGNVLLLLVVAVRAFLAVNLENDLKEKIFHFGGRGGGGGTWDGRGEGGVIGKEIKRANKSRSQGKRSHESEVNQCNKALRLRFCSTAVQTFPVYTYNLN